MQTLYDNYIITYKHGTGFVWTDELIVCAENHWKALQIAQDHLSNVLEIKAKVINWECIGLVYEVEK